MDKYDGETTPCPQIKNKKLDGTKLSSLKNLLNKTIL